MANQDLKRHVRTLGALERMRPLIGWMPGLEFPAVAPIPACTEMVLERMTSEERKDPDLLDVDRINALSIEAAATRAEIGEVLAFLYRVQRAAKS